MSSAIAVIAVTLTLFGPFRLPGPNFCTVDYSSGERVVTGWTATNIPCDMLYPPGIDPPHAR